MYDSTILRQNGINLNVPNAGAAAYESVETGTADFSAFMLDRPHPARPSQIIVAAP